MIFYDLILYLKIKAVELNMDNQTEETSPFPVVIVAGILLIWFVLFAINFHKSYLEALTHYEIAYKLNWSTPKEWIDPALKLELQYKKGKQIEFKRT